MLELRYPKLFGIKTLTGFITAVANTLLLLALGVEFAFLWGVLSFLFNYIPNIGFIIALIPAALVALLQFGIGKRQKHLGAELYERSAERRGYANGYKPKTVKTRVGEVTFAVPQVRDGSFYPDALEKGLRSERALTMTLAEMYVQGVSTRKVAAITTE